MANLKDTVVLGKLNVTDKVIADKIIKLGGTTYEVLLADGTVAKVSTTAQTVAPNAVTTNAARTYIVQKNGDQLVVNVPWVKGESSGGTLTEVNLVGGDGIALSSNTIDSDSDSITISHDDTSDQDSIETGGRTYINSITLDDYGHVTSLGTGTESNQDLSNYVTLDGAQTISGKKTFTGSMKVSGRYANGGDDEGIIIGRASNSYAGLCLGEPSGLRSVFYLTSTNQAIWRYNNGTSSYDIQHPGKTGTIALTSDIPAISGFVTGPSNATNNAIALFDGTGGKTIKNSGLIVDTNNNLTGLNTLNCGEIKFATESQPTITASGLGTAIAVEGIETPIIYAPTTSGGTTYGVGTNGQVLKSNGTTVYWGTDNSGSGGLTSLPTRLAEYSTSGYGDANEATIQGWHYMTTAGNNRPPFKQSSNKDYRIMSTAYSSSWVQQIATDFRGNDMFLRRKENGTWKPWTPIVRFQDCTADHKMQTITDNAIPRWDAGGTAMLQNSTATISDNGHLTIDTTSDSTMATPAVNILHTGPADSNVYADLMVLSGFKKAPYGFKFRTYGNGTAIIQSQRINNNNETFALSLNPNGGDVLVNGKVVATQEWVLDTVIDVISQVTIKSQVYYNGSWVDGWRDPAAATDVIPHTNSASSYTTATVSSNNQTITLRYPYSSYSTKSRWLMTINSSGLSGISINGVTPTKTGDNYKIQFISATSNQTITIAKGEITFKIKIQFNTTSFVD